MNKSKTLLIVGIIVFVSCDSQNEKTTAVDSSAHDLLPEGECVIDEDCSNGGTCVTFPLNSDGEWTTCKEEIVEATQHSTEVEIDECATSVDCLEGESCVLSPIQGVVMSIWNLCLSDECEVDEDCLETSSQMCLLKGIHHTNFNECIEVECKKDSDCLDGSDGKCVLFSVPGIWNESIHGKYCSYSVDECRLLRGCGLGQICQRTEDDNFICNNSYAEGE